MKTLILVLFTITCYHSSAQHYIERFDGKIAKGQILNIENGELIFVHSSIKNSQEYFDTVWVNIKNISNFGIDTTYKNTDSKKYRSKMSLYNLSTKDANEMERYSQNLFTTTAVLSSLSLGGFMVASLYNQPDQPIKSNYYFYSNNNTYYDSNRYLKDSSDYLKNIDVYHNTVNTIRIASGVVGIVAIICATSGVNKLLKSKHNRRLAEHIALTFSPSFFYFGYRF